jgi:hypothetical protein
LDDWLKAEKELKAAVTNAQVPRFSGDVYCKVMNSCKIYNELHASTATLPDMPGGTTEPGSECYGLRDKKPARAVVALAGLLKELS